MAIVICYPRGEVVAGYKGWARGGYRAEIRVGEVRGKGFGVWDNRTRARAPQLPPVGRRPINCRFLHSGTKGVGGGLTKSLLTGYAEELKNRPKRKSSLRGASRSFTASGPRPRFINGRFVTRGGPRRRLSFAGSK